MSKNQNTGPTESAQSEGQQLFSFEDALLIEGEPIWERMGKIAQLCATLVEKHFGESLNFSPESIAILDRVIVSGWGEDVSPDQVPVNVRVSFGAYIGEILVRRTPGRWVSGFSDEEPATILFLDSDDTMLASVSPFLLISEKFTNMYRFDLSIAWAALQQQLTEAGAV